MKIALPVALLALAVPSLSFASSGPRRHGSHARRLDWPLPKPITMRAVNDALAVPDGGRQLAKRAESYNGRGSWFYPGRGACGTYSGDGDYMVALNFDQYGDIGAVSSFCFQTITITYGGKSAQATILDACEACGYGGIDMSPSLFNHFANRNTGIIYVEWTIGSLVDLIPSLTNPLTSFEDDGYLSSTSMPAKTSVVTSQSSPEPELTTSFPPRGSPTGSASHTSTSSGTTASATAIPDIFAPPSERVGGNLDTLSQIILGLGAVIGAAAQDARSA